MVDLRSKLQSFKYEEKIVPKFSSVSKVKKSLPVKQPKVINYDNYSDLQPSLSFYLTVLFIGFNPGLQSSSSQHHYAHFTNSFWKLFNKSNLLQSVVHKDNIPSDEFIICAHTNGLNFSHDYDLVKYNIGFTDLVLKCTRSAQELSSKEKLHNVPRLIEEINSSNSKFIVIIGKGIWESIVKHLSKELNIKFKLSNFTWGLQSDVHEIAYKTILSHFYSQLPIDSRVYVFPSTSGLVTQFTFEEKLVFWKQLAEDIDS